MALTVNQLRVDAALRLYLASGVLSKGDRLPPFPELAKRFGTSVSVLQAVIPRLAAQGILEVMPRVGVFLRRKPGIPKGSQHAGTVIRFAIAESVDGASPGWRKIAERFEQIHPGVQIQLALGVPSDPVLRQPDLLLLVHSHAQQLVSQGGYIEWADEEVWRPDDRIDFARTIWDAGQPTRLLPILFGGQTVFWAKGGTSPQLPTRLPDLARTCFQADTAFGLVVDAAMDTFCTYGMGGAGIDPEDRCLREWLGLIATMPPPKLVMLDDFADDAITTRMAPLVGRRCRAFIGQLWMARLAERGAWDLHLPPGHGPVGANGMDLVVPEGPNAEASIALARFISCPEGQEILSSEDSLLPTCRSVAAKHRQAGFLKAIEQRGLLSSPALDLDSSWQARRMAAEQTIRGLRTGRATVDEALAALVNIDHPKTSA